MKIYQFKAKYSKIKPYPLCLGNISKDFTANNIKKQMDRSTIFQLIINIMSYAILSMFSNIIDVHKYFMRK